MSTTMQVILFVGLVEAVIAGGIAGNKNRNPLLWGILGFALGLIGIIIVILLPSRRVSTTASSW